MSTYKSGTTMPNILLNVDVNTIGVAATRASKRLTGASGGGISVAHSVDATGDIKNSDIGAAASLSGNSLIIATLINLLGDKTERKTEFAGLSATYSLSGGDEGVKNFADADLKLHNADYTRVTLVKSISLIP